MFVIVTVFVTDSASLRVLNVTGNAIGDDGMSLISSKLWNNNILTELWVENCEFSVKGTIEVCKV